MHINSGIPNHAFYLAAIALKGFAWEKAGRIWYATLTDGRLSTNADFQAFASLTVQKAAELFAEAERRAVADAWAQVGINVVAYENMGGTCSSPPQVAWGPNRLDVFVLGMDKALYHKWWDGNAWRPSVTDYENMGGTCSSPPQVAWGPNRLDVFVLGMDKALYHSWWDGNAWRPSVTAASGDRSVENLPA